MIVNCKGDGCKLVTNEEVINATQFELHHN